MLYPNLTGQFGASLTVGKKTDFPAATPDAFKVNQAGVFYRVEAKTYMVHLKKDTPFSLERNRLERSVHL
jgi:cytochrome b6-f complex iron-sulfur subunit